MAKTKERVFISSTTAAELSGLSRERFRNEMVRQRKRGSDFRAPAEEWIDTRTPLYDRALVESWAATRSPRAGV